MRSNIKISYRDAQIMFAKKYCIQLEDNIGNQYLKYGTVICLCEFCRILTKEYGYTDWQIMEFKRDYLNQDEIKEIEGIKFRFMEDMNY